MNIYFINYGQQIGLQGSVGRMINSTLNDIDDNQWNYIVWVKTSSRGGKIYKNGILVFSGTFENVAYYYSRLDLGAEFYTSYENHFKGWIDEVRISNTERSQSEINNYYIGNQPFGADANTVGLWHFDENSGTKTNGEKGPSGTIKNGSWTTGRFGSCVYYNGTNSTASFDLTIPTSNMTIEFWIKPNGKPITPKVFLPVSLYGDNTTTFRIEAKSVIAQQDGQVNTSTTSSQNTQESNIPTTEELTQKLEIINDNYEEIKYLNSVIHAIILSPLKSNYGTLYSLCYFHKLNIELPQLYDDPSITLSEWQENLNFIELLGNDFCASKKDNSQMELRGLYLYYKVCLKQKINGHPDVNDLKLITSEFNQNNFPIKGSFFNSCKEVLEQANNNYSSNTNSGNSNNTPSKPKITKEEFKKHVIYDNTSTTECVLCNRTVYCTKRPQSELNQEIDINYNLVIENNFRLNIFENMSKGIKDNDATFVKTYKCDSHCADCKKKYGFTH